MAAVTNFFSSLFKPSAAAPALPANRRNVEVASGNFPVNATAPQVVVNNRNVPGSVAVGGKRNTRKSKAQRRASRKNNRKN